MADYSQIGAGLMAHIKAYIDDRIGYRADTGSTTVDSNEGSATQITGVESYFDPFNTNLSPLSLPLPDAFARLTAVLATHADSDHVIVWISSHSWEDFYRKLLTAARDFPDFLDTATSTQQRFGFASSPATETPQAAVILAGDGYAALADWVGRYDQVYSAVLVMRFTAGKVPAEYR